ncbi:MAG: hypothetical protein J7599_10330 [Niabella sp.]|nr:hypothetical protein [Niabella sp.]
MCNFFTNNSWQKSYTWFVLNSSVKHKKSAIKKTLAILLLSACCSCTSPRYPVRQPVATSPITLNGKRWSSLYQQKAAEYAALCYQAYNMARISLDRSLQAGSSGKPPAIVTDIDETFLDNSPYAVRQAAADQDYDSKT